MAVIETRGKSVAGQKKVPVLVPLHVQKGLEYLKTLDKPNQKYVFER